MLVLFYVLEREHEGDLQLKLPQALRDQNLHHKLFDLTVTNKEICLVRIVFAYAYSVVLFCSLGY